MNDLETYRAKAAAWLESVAPTFGREARKGLSEADDLALGRRYQKAKFDAGYAGINWPTEYGGQGLTHLEKVTFDAEEMKHGFPSFYFGISLGMPVPVLMQFGSDKEFVKERVLKALQGQEIWCQLFSEPSGGSDLAGLRTRAEPDGNGWKINGQKVWTSWAHYSDYGVIVVRTDPTVPKHKGLTYFWVDMKAPGVTVRPIKLAGGDSHVNEVFFDDVLVPHGALVGTRGQGWQQVTAELGLERSGPERYLSSHALLAALIDAAGAEPDPAVAVLIGELTAEMWTLRQLSMSTAAKLAAGEDPMVEASVVKELGNAFEQDMPRRVQAIVDCPWDDPGDLGRLLRALLIASPSFSLRGGTREVIRGIIARGLGLR